MSWSTAELRARLARHKTGLSPPVKYFTDPFKAVPLLRIIYVISVLILLCFRARLFIGALWSLAGKRLTSWLLFVMSNREVVIFPLVSWLRCGCWLYRFLIFAIFLTFCIFDLEHLTPLSYLVVFEVCAQWNWFKPESKIVLLTVPRRYFFCGSFVLFLYCVVMLLRLSISALWSPTWKELTSSLSFVVLNCVFVTFSLGILGQVWYLIESKPFLLSNAFVVICRQCGIIMPSMNTLHQHCKNTPSHKGIAWF